MCFKLAVLGKVLQDRNLNVHVIYNYLKLQSVYNWDCVSFPVKLDDIPRFEDVNDISINIYGVNERLNKVFPMKVVDRRKRDHRDILFYRNHYSWIKNFSALVTKQITRKKAKLYVCRKCFKHFYKNCELEKHESMDNCVFGNTVVVQNGGVLKFKNYHHQLQIPYVIYLQLHFELQKTQTCEPSKDESFVHPFARYVPSGYTYHIVFRTVIVKSKTSNNVNDLIESLVRECKVIKLRYTCNYPPHSTQPISSFQTGQMCHICEEPILDDPVLDHDHLLENDNIRGYAHNKCNLNFRLPRFVPIMTEDLAKQNGTTILKELMKYQNHQTCCTQQFYHKPRHHTYGYKIFKTRHIRPSHYNQNKQYSAYNLCNYCNVSVIPYKQDVDRFLSINVSLGRMSMRFIDMCQMFPDLSLRSQSSSCQVQIGFIEQIRMYERLRSICFDHYKLDMYYYLTMGAFSFDSMLKTTKVSLELIEDAEMHKMFSSNIRGGLVTTLQNYTSGDHIYYFDIIGLYSKIMLDFPLPLDRYEWVTDLSTIDLENDNESYILEVDLHYPSTIDHIIPLCPEFVDGRLRSLHRDKTKYVIHHRLLKLVLSMGMVLMKVHRAIRFRESLWLREYIKLNIKLREEYSSNNHNSSSNDSNSSSDLHKLISNYFKTMSNVIYGKCCERVENRLNVHVLSSNPTKLMKLVKRSAFKDRSIVSEDQYVVYTGKMKVKINKPYSVAFSILDIAKGYMYHMLYEQMQKRLPRFDVIYHDTDCYVVKFMDDPALWLNKCGDIFHFGPGLGQVGKFRDKCAGNPIVEFIIVTNKVYSYSCVNDYKHVGKNLPADFNFDIYKKILSSTINNRHKKVCGVYDRKIDSDWYLVMVNKQIPSLT